MEFGERRGNMFPLEMERNKSLLALTFLSQENKKVKKVKDIYFLFKLS